MLIEAVVYKASSSQATRSVHLTSIDGIGFDSSDD